MTVEQPLYNVSEVRELERIAIEDCGIDAALLMQRAGAGAFATLRQRWPAARRLAILCGPGNNGGDGFIIGRLAQDNGLTVELTLIGRYAPGSAAAQAAADFVNAGGSIQAFHDRFGADADVIVDALLGIGLTRPVEGEYRHALDRLSTMPAPVLAIDVPSGLNADTGMCLGRCLRATATVTYIAHKCGLFTGQAPDYVGELRLDTLALPQEIYARVTSTARILGRDRLSHYLPPRARNTHKGSFGNVLVIGGDHGMAGAVRLAATAALRAGAGLVTVATRPAHTSAMLAACSELLCHGLENADDVLPLLDKAGTLAIGPGLGASAWSQTLLAHALHTRRPAVIDADALNLLAHTPDRIDTLKPWILTPHPAEAARLLDTTTAAVQADRYAAVRALATRFRCVCVLKGAGSLIAVPGGKVSVCTHGNAGMATAGMGDVLTGVIAGLLAQGLDYASAARYGVLVHALAGDAAAAHGERGLLASDLMPHIRALVNP